METSIKEKLDAFFSQYKKLSFNKGEILLRANQNPIGVFYLTSGAVRTYIISQKR